MVFSSPIFLFGFLTVMLALYYISPQKSKNLMLLAGSLLFYAWGEGQYVLLMIISIALNYCCGLLIGKRMGATKRRALIIGVALNLVLLIFFKYFNFLIENASALLNLIVGTSLPASHVHLPIGISFFTFQAISYLVDVYRQKTAPQENLLDLALYITLFPQLIAGPIVRYNDVAMQMHSRGHSMDLFASGIQRFVIGLSKKMLIANPLGYAADLVFNAPATELGVTVAWLGIIAYSLQIYYDFSGYSDMAIGLARMFGFHFLENFNLPYISASIREFWRRWHISLSTWFRDYLYLPLGGNRVAPGRLYLNLILVFLLCGLWHGASWNFVIWGLIHGLFLVLERTRFGRRIDQCGPSLRHSYTLLVILWGWVFFRSETLLQAIQYTATLVGLNGSGSGIVNVALIMSREAWLALVAGLLWAGPLQAVWSRLGVHTQLPPLASVAGLICLLAACLVQLAAGTYNPFIYFRF